MRKTKIYKKVQGSKRQRKRLEALNRLQDDIAKYFYDDRFKKKK